MFCNRWNIRPNTISIAYRWQEKNFQYRPQDCLKCWKENITISFHCFPFSFRNLHKINKNTKLWNGIRSHLFKHGEVPSLIACALRLVERSGRHPTSFDFTQGYETNSWLHVVPIQSADNGQLKLFASCMVARHYQRWLRQSMNVQPIHDCFAASSWNLAMTSCKLLQVSKRIF